jgi:hypothetical protein
VADELLSSRTLHKIYAFLEAQQDGNKLKHLFRHNEMQILLKGCHAGLEQAAEVFKVWSIFIFLTKG